jgi:hypothetical protein
LIFGNFTDTSDFGGGVAAERTINIGNIAVADSLLGEPFRSSSTDIRSLFLVGGGLLALGLIGRRRRAKWRRPARRLLLHKLGINQQPHVGI